MAPKHLRNSLQACLSEFSGLMDPEAMAMHHVKMLQEDHTSFMAIRLLFDPDAFHFLG